MHPLAFLLPAALCAAGVVFYVAEAAAEHRTVAARLNPKRGHLAQLIALGTLCALGCGIALAPVLEFAAGAAR